MSESIIGLASVLGSLDAFGSMMKARLEHAIADATEGTFNDAVDAVPVDTGELKDSASMTVAPTKGTVTFGTNHAWYIELGTHKMSAQPYLLPAFESNGAKFHLDVSSGLQ